MIGSACGRTPPQARDDQPSQVSTSPPSPCPAPDLEPGYLPSGVRPTTRTALFADPERTRTWEGDDVLVQLLEGFAADHGDDPDVRRTRVRGDDLAYVSSLQTKDGNVLLVDWSEDTRCGHKQYAVVSSGLSEDETLKVARSLEDHGTGERG